MIMIDSSVWVDLLRDTTGRKVKRLGEVIDSRDVVLGRFTELELLQGARDESEWDLLSRYLATQSYLEPGPETWANAARIYFDLRRTGKTVRSTIDCALAQLAIDHKVLLVHRDRDFEVIATVRPLQQVWLDWEG